MKVASSFHDLQELEAIYLNEPAGWVHISAPDTGGGPIRTFFIQITVLANHQSRQDTHLRQIKVRSPLELASVCTLLRVIFTSVEYFAFSSVC